MSEDAPRLALLTPYGIDEAQAEKTVAALKTACAVGDVAAVILRLATADERSLVGLVKRLVPAAQEHGAAVVVCSPGFQGDLVAVAARGGADGVHVDKADETELRELRGRLRDGRILGSGGFLESKHAAMAAGETQADYLMFGGLYPDGVAPDRDLVRERAAWWAEIFETPCIAVAAEAGEVGVLAATGAEFVGLEGSLWFERPDAVAAAMQAVATAGANR
ncbi:thiamine phosphate synthase [Methylobacterium haplocladii]|uniref:Thiamine phosphate synthase n=1 Tax=Methylobacterium haplocladii TaxID=1176176 RepID=A0A512IQY3_9HYPH|nr:thiamine phosphate synthase [Methylobacterium haplocladii]GEP00127.1 thiamine phosphate synthase [Methylobacterium haplocladii]GJD85378.1 Thiamine-phosphate synthase [Methylobacterium haplocladii]GLS58175.1 thiamine phosphate synthase [Methylobacterium haplocladii]